MGQEMMEINWSEVLALASVNVPALGLAGWLIKRSVSEHDKKHDSIDISLSQTSQQVNLIAAQFNEMRKEITNAQINHTIISKIYSNKEDIDNIGSKIRKMNDTITDLSNVIQRVKA